MSSLSKLILIGSQKTKFHFLICSKLNHQRWWPTHVTDVTEDVFLSLVTPVQEAAMKIGIVFCSRADCARRTCVCACADPSALGSTWEWRYTRRYLSGSTEGKLLLLSGVSSAFIERTRFPNPTFFLLRQPSDRFCVNTNGFWRISSAANLMALEVVKTPTAFYRMGVLSEVLPSHSL